MNIYNSENASQYLDHVDNIQLSPEQVLELLEPKNYLNRGSYGLGFIAPFSHLKRITSESDISFSPNFVDQDHSNVIVTPIYNPIGQDKVIELCTALIAFKEKQLLNDPTSEDLKTSIYVIDRLREGLITYQSNHFISRRNQEQIIFKNRIAAHNYTFGRGPLEISFPDGKKMILNTIPINTVLWCNDQIAGLVMKKVEGRKIANTDHFPGLEAFVSKNFGSDNLSNVLIQKESKGVIHATVFDVDGSMNIH